MNRRKFVVGAGACASGAVLCDFGLELALRPARADEGCAGPPAGVQLYTIRERLEREPLAALAALREIGIVEAELYGLNGNENGTLFGLPAAELKRAFDANGLSVPVSHVGGDLANTAAIADLAHALGIGTLAVALPSEFSAMRDGRFMMVPAESRAQLDALAEKLNRAGGDYRERGLVFGYHNHHIEFMSVDGVVPFDYLMSNTDPDLVKIELDIGWLALAGVEPVEYLQRYAGRVIACHMKDYDPAIGTDVPQRKLVAPGAGTIDFAAVLAAMVETNVAHAFLEVDVSDDPLGDVARGYRHLQRLQGCV
jgi:sugar phosphate isomerase/epimerase